MVSIPACHAGDRGSIPRRGVFLRKVYDQPLISLNSTTNWTTNLTKADDEPETACAKPEMIFFGGLNEGCLKLFLLIVDLG